MSDMLSAIHLVRTKPAGDLTAEEADLVRRVAEASPALAGAVGGREALTSYLSNLPAAGSEPPPGSLAESSPPYLPQASDSRRGLRWRAAAIAAAALLAAFAGLILFREGVQQPAKKSAKQEARSATGDPQEPKDAREDGQRASKDGASQPQHGDSSTGGAAMGKRQTQHSPGTTTAVKTSAPGEKPANKAGTEEDKPERRAWRGWDIRASDDCLLLMQTDWDLSNPAKPVPSNSLLTTNGEVHLSRTIEIAGDEPWLQLRLQQPEGKPLTGRFRVSIGQQSVELPSVGSDASRAVWLVSLAQHSGRSVPVEISCQSANDKLPIRWESLTVGPVRTNSLEIVSPEAPSAGLVVARFRMSPWRVFEDEPSDAGRRQAGLPDMPTTSAAVFSGTLALELPPDGQPIVLSSKSTSIRKTPSEGECRFLRLALRKTGDGTVQVVLRRHDGTAVRTYVAGRRVQDEVATASMWRWPVPDEWILLTCDVFADFGELDFDQIAVQSTGGGRALVDHVYLAAEREDFATVKTLPRDARGRSPLIDLALSQPEVYGAMRAIVSVDVAGRRGGGVVVEPSGLVATTAYVACAPQRKARIVLFDGRVVEGTTLGVNRQIDVALIRIDSPGPFEHAVLTGGWPRGSLYAAAPVGSWEKGKAIVFGPAGIRGSIGGFAWSNMGINLSHSGGVLISSSGQILGLHSRPSPLGGGLHVPAGRVKECWEALLAGKESGAWSNNMAPTLGVAVQERDGQIVVVAPPEAADRLPRKGDRLLSFDGHPIKALGGLQAELSKKNPGDLIAVELIREDKTLKVDVPLRHSH